MNRSLTMIALVAAAGCSHGPGQTSASCTPTASGVTCTLPPTTTGYTLTIEGAGGTPVTGVPVGVNDDLQALINANPDGTQFTLKAGVHRMQRATPKNNQKFTGESGAVMNGARVLTMTKENTYWVASVGQLQPVGPTIGECATDYPACASPEDLFYTNGSGSVKPMKRLTGLPVSAGAWYLDYTAGKVYAGSDPTGQTVELSTADYLFTGGATGVTVEKLTVEKYATPAQRAAINYNGDGKAWIVQNNEVRWCHGMAIRSSDNSQLLNNKVHDIGELGMGGSGTNVLVQGNELWNHNLYAGYNPAWEGGATKFTYTDGLKVIGNNSHDNYGIGWWTDIDNINTEVSGNTFARNTLGGYSHEISYDAKVHDNQFIDNGPADCSWLWYGAMQIQNSQNVEVWNNTVQVPGSGQCGNGITIIQQDRGSGAHGPYVAINNHVHNNTVTFMGGTEGANGGVTDFKNPDIFAPSSKNVYENNTYRSADPSGQWFAWSDSYRDFASMQSLGQENGSTMTGGVGSGSRGPSTRSLKPEPRKIPPKPR